MNEEGKTVTREAGTKALVMPRKGEEGGSVHHNPFFLAEKVRVTAKGKTGVSSKENGHLTWHCKI